MKRLLLLVLVCTAIHLRSFPGSAQRGAAGFEKIKALAGEWEGKTSSGNPARVSYWLTSGGAAVIETLNTGDEPEMVTLYHLDKGVLMLTPYCVADHQPRVRAQDAGEGNRLTFSFFDATNLATASAGHMHRLVLVFEDAKRLIAKWTWREKGQGKTEGFELTRKI